MNKSIVHLLLFVFILAGCKGDKSSNFPDTDLLKHGFAIKVKAPEGAEIASDDFGIMQELSIKSGEDYNVQILKSNSITTNLTQVKNDQLKLVKVDPYFTKVVEEYDNGFIFEKDIDGNVHYDFRYVKIVGDKEFIYQTGMTGTFTEEQSRIMYKSVQ